MGEVVLSNTISLINAMHSHVKSESTCSFIVRSTLQLIEETTPDTVNLIMFLMDIASLLG
jgi:hypothetical protein